MPNISTVDFHNDTLLTIEEGGVTYVAIKPICDSLGLNWNAQRKKITNDPLLSKGCALTTLPSVGGMQETVCLDIKRLHGWLFKIEPRRIKNEQARRKILMYQDECYETLHYHFTDKKTKSNRKQTEATLLNKVRQARITFGKKAGREMWLNCGLDTVPSMFERRFQRQGSLKLSVVGNNHNENT